jgi:AAHS family 4-hydroxybenzoate transporter-like MFS transporter
VGPNVLPIFTTGEARNDVSTIQDTPVDIGELIDGGPWTTPQNVTLALACFAVICDGFDNLVFGLAIPALSRGLLVSPKAFGIVFAFSFVGLSVGTISAGRLGDRYGRKPVLLVSLLIFGVFTAALSTAHGIRGLTVLRFLAGIGLGGAIPNLTALVAECSPARHRALAVTLTALAMTVGGMVGAGIASWILPAFGWRTLFVVAGSIPLVALPALYFMLPESPKYLAGNPLRRERLLRVLDMLRVPFPRERPITRREEASGDRVDSRMLFKPVFLRDTIALWMTFFFTMAVGYMLLNWIPTILSEAGFSLRQSSLGLFTYNCGGILGAILGALIVRHSSSRVVIYFCIGGVMVALFAGAGPRFTVTNVAFPVAVLFILGAFVIAASSSIFAIASNAYPTALRSMGIGSAVAFGRLGAIGSSFMGAATSGAAGGSRISFQVAAALLAGQAISMMFLTRHVSPVAGMKAAVTPVMHRG